MKNQKGFIVPLIILIVVLVVVSGGVYMYTQNNNSPTITKKDEVVVQQPVSTENKDQPTSTASNAEPIPVQLEYQTYSNPLFTIQYPSGLKKYENKEKDLQQIGFSVTGKPISGSLAIVVFNKTGTTTAEYELNRYLKVFKGYTKVSDVMISGIKAKKLIVSIENPSVHTYRVIFETQNNVYDIATGGTSTKESDFDNFYSSFKLK